MTGQHDRRRRDPGPQAIAFGATLALHTIVAAGVLWGTIREAPAVVVEPPIEFVWTELPKLGEERDPKLLERIVQAPQPEATTAPVNLNQQREEEPTPPEVKKPDEVEKQVEQPDPEAEKKRLADEKKKRDRDMAKAVAQFDERADEDSPEGLRDGFAEGTSTRAAQLREESIWAAQVAAKIQEQLQRPAAISPGECRKLATLIPIKLTAAGKVSNEPVIQRGSGNQFFDDAAVRALRYFTDDGRGTLPLPRADRLPKLREAVQRQGVPVNLECKP